jgi:hypothetical protein
MLLTEGQINDHKGARLLLKALPKADARRKAALFAIERSINGKSQKERLAVRRTLSRPAAFHWRLGHHSARA